LGFGLSHLYPITYTTELRDMVGRLRGEDAYVYQACRELQLQPTLRAVYNEDGGATTYGIMLDRIVKLSYNYIHDFNDAFQTMGGVVVNKLQDALVGAVNRFEVAILWMVNKLVGSHPSIGAIS
jgi:hypothetical protein